MKQRTPLKIAHIARWTCAHCTMKKSHNFVEFQPFKVATNIYISTPNSSYPNIHKFIVLLSCRIVWKCKQITFFRLIDWETKHNKTPTKTSQLWVVHVFSWGFSCVFLPKCAKNAHLLEYLWNNECSNRNRYFSQLLPSLSLSNACTERHCEKQTVLQQQQQQQFLLFEWQRNSRIVIVSFCLNCCWCWYVWCDCSMVLVDVCIAHTCWGCCFLPFVRVCLCLYACECRFCFPFSLEKVFNSFGSSFSMRIFSCAVFLVSCVHSIRVRINAISLLFFPTRIYCCWWWYLLCFCRFPSLKFNLFNLSLLNFYLLFLPLPRTYSNRTTSTLYISYIYVMCIWILNVIAKFLGEIKIICTKNSFDFSLLSGNTMLNFSENFTPFDWFYSGYDDDWLQMTILIQQLRQRMNHNDRIEGGGEMRVRNELHNEFNKNRKCNEFDKLQCNPLKNRNVLGSSFFLFGHNKCHFDGISKWICSWVGFWIHAWNMFYPNKCSAISTSFRMQLFIHSWCN